jgi:Domain of unknown function (DUF4276)
LSKHVVVIASGETERRALPHLVEHLRAENVLVMEIRRPDGKKALTVEMAEKLVKAAWFAPAENITPDKFVILLDADGKDADEILRPFKEQLRGRLGPKITAALQFACAQWHLEAWYFADISSLRSYLGRDPGSVDASTPDEIKNPKLHLKNLLGDRAYTAVVSEEIARQLNAKIIAERSPSFCGFLDCVRNGELATESLE